MRSDCSRSSIWSMIRSQSPTIVLNAHASSSNTAMRHIILRQPHSKWYRICPAEFTTVMSRLCQRQQRLLIQGHSHAQLAPGQSGKPRQKHEAPRPHHRHHSSSCNAKQTQHNTANISNNGRHRTGRSARLHRAAITKCGILRRYVLHSEIEKQC